MDEDAAAEEEWPVVARGLENVEFQFFDGKDWRERWDSNDAAAAPRAVRVTLTRRTRDDVLVKSSVAACTSVVLASPQALSDEASTVGRLKRSKD